MHFKTLLGLTCSLLIQESFEHGMMLEPVGRSSIWRFNESAPHNYDDNQNFCGGEPVQWDIFGGKCGVCGDKYDDPHPQANENTGIYGQGVVVREYAAGSVIDTNVLLTKNHKGYFKYSVCVLEDPNASESGEDCFLPLHFEDGSEHYPVTPDETSINNRLKLPDGLVCERCVFRWHYTAGNTWGDCGNGTSATGCGPQETFRSCADIAII